MNSTDIDYRPSTATLGDLSTSDKHCVFRSQKSWFSVPAVSVREISIAPDRVRVPHCHSLLAGVCHLRSEFIPVIWLNALLEIDASATSSSRDKLMVINGHSVWGLLVAEVAALESLETLLTPETRTDDASHSAVMGTAMFRNQIVRVLDPNRIFQMAQHALEDLWQLPQQTLHSSRRKLESQR